MKIVIDNAIPFLEGVLEPYAEIRYLPGREIAARDVRDADALIVRTRTRCDAALLDGSRVRFIATAATPAAYCNGSQPYCITSRSATGGIRPKRRWEWSARDTSGSWYAGTPHRGDSAC